MQHDQHRVMAGHLRHFSSNSDEGRREADEHLDRLRGSRRKSG
jgi:hypothetical protein